jgi:hypothetical protein
MPEFVEKMPSGRRANRRARSALRIDTGRSCLAIRREYVKGRELHLIVVLPGCNALKTGHSGTILRLSNFARLSTETRKSPAGEASNRAIRQYTFAIKGSLEARLIWRVCPKGNRRVSQATLPRLA